MASVLANFPGVTKMWAGRAAVLLFLFAVPGGPTPLFDSGGHDLSRIAQVAVSLVCAIALLVSASLDRRDRLWDRRLVLGAVAIALLAVASTLQAPVFAAAMRELTMTLGLVGIAAVIARGREEHQLELLVTTVVAAASLYSMLALLSICIVITNAGPLDSFEVTLGYNNYRHFNHVQTVVLPLLVIACGRSIHNGQSSRLGWFALAINVALLIFTRGRGTMVALIGGTLLSVLLFRRAALDYVLHLAAGIGAGVVVYLVLFVGLPMLTGSVVGSAGRIEELASVNARFMLWRLALDYITQAPWFGVGPMHYSHHPNFEAAHPHNIYFQLAAEWGVPLMVGLVAWAAWAASRMARAVKACTNPEKATMGVGLFTAMVAIAIDGMFSGNFVMPVSQVWIASAIGWAVAWTRSNAAVDAPAPGDRMRLSWHWAAGLAAMLVASQAWLSWSIAPEALDLRAYFDHVSLDISKGHRVAPRFWSDGWF